MRSVPVFAAFARELALAEDEDAVLEVVARRSLELVPAAHSCGVTIRRRRDHFDTPTVTHPLAAELDELQYALAEGPCVITATEHELTYVPDTAADGTWPRWSREAAARGIGSVLSAQLSGSPMSRTHAPLGAVNLYSTEPEAFTDDDVEAARALAVFAANELASARVVQGLERAVSGRHTIGVAQGILMSELGVDLDASFSILKRLSSQTNTKVRDLAERVVAHRGLPPGLGAVASPGRNAAARLRGVDPSDGAADLTG